MSTRYVVLYESAADVLRRAPDHMVEHTAHYESYAARGLLVGIGTFEDPAVNGAMCVLVSRDAAEEFAAGDPFVVHGLVVSYRILAWNDVLG
ncbi:hypothetical protein Cch01nite_12520 [Cellulomonas chitinilytica]|uniref:YCII-related domain-containing protein n=1 Tax=Cellulomonas chitinilytica TaxID=398759 RepID=A0A919TZ66_9CELL|nr:YciI family protein [Cellulomonas chitinilytica]GIG20528.1 hypothetical protein Cch01nite_12520 [Cellulomonas chitinilytica]